MLVGGSAIESGERVLIAMLFLVCYSPEKPAGGVCWLCNRFLLIGVVTGFFVVFIPNI
jgi:hypothetical protein